MTRILEGITAPLGRFLLSIIFIVSAIHKITNWSGTYKYMEEAGMQVVTFFLVIAILVEFGGGLSILLGIKARLGALALFAFLIPVTLIFHDFWQYAGQEQTQQMFNFLRNLAIMGGLCFVVGYGAGSFSFDSYWRKRRLARKR